jgi:hypothetical protein
MTAPVRPTAVTLPCALLIGSIAGTAPALVKPWRVPEGWHLAGETQVYQPDRLWEQINGAAPGYLRYSFQELTVQTLQLAADPKAEILVEVYRFGNHLDAFGIYSTERTPNLTYVRLGAEGYHVGPASRFYKGDHYVKLQGSRDDEAVGSALRAAAQALASALPGAVRPPALLKALPTEGLVPGSERYEGSDLLALDFLGAGFTADYTLGGEKPSKLFLTVRPDGAQARDGYYRLLGFLRRRGEVGGSVDVAGADARVTKHPFYGPSLIARSGPVVCGVLRTPGPEVAAPLIEGLLRRLRALGVTKDDP